MLYLSTRNNKISKKPSEAVLEGIAKDGGLYMPHSFDGVEFPLKDLEKMSNKEISAQVISLLFKNDEMLSNPKGELAGAYDLVSKAYDGKFDDEDYAPLAKVADAYVMELYHGPTCAFKDVALQLLPQLISSAKKSTGMKDEIVILTATSGDTGSAALSGFSNVDGIKIIVFYPRNGISAVQERQMVSVDGKNTCVCSVGGNFDDAQSGVKNIFASLDLPKGVVLSSANSINIGRLAPQVAYYFKSYRDLLLNKEIKMGELVNFVVPTGNFGDILAGYFAKKMGLPVGQLVCASNTNKVLTDFFENGVYNKNRSFYITKSPSMDILISSNLERLLYLVCGAEKCAYYMNELKEKGEYKLEKEELDKIRNEFDAGFCDDEETLETIKKVYENERYLMDTHTAVAWNVYEKWQKKTGNKNKTVVLSTASPYKFSSSVMNALGQEYGSEFDAVNKLYEYTGAKIPGSLVNIESKPIVHTVTVEKDEMLSFVDKMVNKKKWME